MCFLCVLQGLSIVLRVLDGEDGQILSSVSTILSIVMIKIGPYPPSKIVALAYGFSRSVQVCLPHLLGAWMQHAYLE